jgi:hypothetical protein
LSSRTKRAIFILEQFEPGAEVLLLGASRGSSRVMPVQQFKTFNRFAAFKSFGREGQFTGGKKKKDETGKRRLKKTVQRPSQQ